jgi:FkbM family methyltransferase
MISESRMNSMFRLKRPHKENPSHANTKPMFETLSSLGFQPAHIVDVGAHEGAWTRSSMVYFADSKYTLFEPQRSLLEPQIDLDAPNVKKYFVGVGPRTENRLFTEHSRRDSYSFALTEEQAKERGFKQGLIPVVSLDEFFVQSDWPKPDVLKIDAEGWDLEVLRGATQVLNNCELVLLEAGVLNKRFQNTALSVMNEMDAKGFQLFDITDLNRTPSLGGLWNVELAFAKKAGKLVESISQYL